MAWPGPLWGMCWYWPETFLYLPDLRAGAAACSCRRNFLRLVRSVREWREFVAQKVQTLVVDDIDGSAAEGTVRFGLDGTDYEIDLNANNAQALRDALAPYVTAGRRAGGAAR